MHFLCEWSHATLISGTAVNESVFWKNYFFHCERLRIKLENERRNQHKGPGDHESADDKPVVASSSLRPDSSKKCSDFRPLIPRKSSCKEYDVDDTVYVSKEDALPPFVQKYPQTLSNGSLVLIGADEGDLDALAEGLSK